ncbi:hypothetical protein [Methylotenera mobilis]|uniref:Uncharacterized protein n=1 Tax=Methylotenera mobilis (strain JLW8 / ATCC BAA-1282 / DSM 17540) TaxID=583345 RepID=C6WY93_METML|nr:hypothetical protein [Methylotenera mobilis]ACT46989.1 hypothetical protein Mmol_0078 [Methylotenera mobilis JLW8]
MFDALHPIKPDLISHEEYLKFAVALNYTKPNDAPPARCPVCMRQMKVRAGKKKADGHFYHDDSLFCPTKDPAKRPYLNLAPRLPNEAAVRANRLFTENNIEQIYSRVKAITSYLDFKEFIEILEEAKRLNVYGYANLIPDYLPYIFVTLINFLPSKSFKKSRQLKFCFFYEDKIRTYDELWINKGFSSNLIRVSYNNVTTQKVKIIETSTDYLTETPVTLSPAQKDWCYKVM